MDETQPSLLTVLNWIDCVACQLEDIAECDIKIERVHLTYIISARWDLDDGGHHEYRYAVSRNTIANKQLADLVQDEFVRKALHAFHISKTAET